MEQLTVLLPTFNCERTVRQCLESVAWVGRILVVDSFSSDNTLEICRKYTDWILQHGYINSASQKNWAMDHISTEWVLQIDSDETLEPGLREEILDILPRSGGMDGYRIPRKNLIWGRWVRSCGYYPDYQLRLFRAANGRWSDRAVHARVEGLDVVKTLNHHLIHNDVYSLSVELQQFARQVINWELQELRKRDKRWRWRDVTLRPAALFALYYFRLGGYRDGFRGFFLSVYRAFYIFMVYAMLYEDEVRRRLRE